MTARFCASVHYFRTPVGRWEAILDRLSAAGIQGIDVYVPWNEHEREEGRFDFGEGDPRLDLPRFLGLVADRGMWILLRPGPQVNAELRNFGLPDRIVRDERIQARSPRGRPVFCPSPPVFFPAPSCASPGYEEEACRWFAAVGGAVGDAGQVRLVQVDNEAALFFREAPFDQDYRPEALALWKEWTGERGMDGQDPPIRREPGRDGLVRALAWIRFRRWMMARFIGRLREGLARAGLRGPFSHNMPPSGLWQPLAGADLAGVVDVVATDVYSTAAGFAQARDQILTLRSSEPEPFAAEMGCGTVWYAPGVTQFDNRFAAAAGLAYGLKGFNLYMGVGRDRWIGGLVAEGAEREGSDLLHFIQRLIRLMGVVGIQELEPVSGATIAIPRSYVDHSLASFPVPGGSPSLLAALGLPVHEMLVRDDWGLGLAVQSAWMERVRAFQEALAGGRVPYVISDGTHAAGPGLLLVPTYRYLPRDVMAKVLSHPGPVVAGPEDPLLDESLDPLPEDLVRAWKDARESGSLVVARDVDSAESAAAIAVAGRSVAEGLPYEATLVPPHAEILPYRSGGGGRWVSWIVSASQPGSRIALAPRRGWGWTRMLSIRPRAPGGEFVQEKGDGNLVIDLAGTEVHLVEWRQAGVE